MILELEQWYLGYDQMLRDCRGNGGGAIATTTTGSVLLLANADVDSVAAARVWSYMLRADGIPYQLLPCRSMVHLEHICRTVVGSTVDPTNDDDDNDEEDDDYDTTSSSSNVRAIVLINLGASRNLTRLFTAQAAVAVDGVQSKTRRPLLPASRVKLYVTDCRRPVHLSNVHAGENVVVFWDHVQDEQGDIPSDGDNLSGNDSSSEEEDDEDDEDDEDSLEQEEIDHDEGEQEFQDDDGQQGANPQDDEDDNDHDVPMTGMEEQDPDYDGEDENERHHDDDNRQPSDKRRKNKPKDDDDSSANTNPADDDDDDNDDYSDMEEDDDGLTKKGRPAGGNEATPATAVATQSTAPMTTQQQQQQQQNSQFPTATMTPRELYQDRRNRLRAYYSSGFYYGSPASYVAYRVSSQLRFGHLPDLLWLACVGVTSSYLHARLDVAGYTALALDLKSHVLRLFPNSMTHRAESAVYAEHLTNSTAGRRMNYASTTTGGGGGELTKIGFSENGRILCEDDFRFFLLRHSSLFDAMVYSDYLSTRLQLSTSRGMHKLQELLAKMGFPLSECHQPFAFMKPSLRRRLQEQIRDHADDYGLNQDGGFEFTSFFRVTGYQSLVSASDISYAVTALLEYAPSTSLSSHPSSPTSIAAAAAAGFTVEDQREEEELFQAFNHAYDALNSNATAATSSSTMSLGGAFALNAGEGSSLSNLVNGGSLSGTTGLGAGIRLAMALQRTIMATAASLIDRNAITRLSHFRYAYITCTSQAEHQGFASSETALASKTKSKSKNSSSMEEDEDQNHHVFAKPLTLTRLAHYLMDLHRENGKWTGSKARPLILLAEKPRTRSFVVVGFEYPELAGHFVKNKFGKNFELAAQSMKGTFKFDSFDSNVVEVAAADVQRFIEQLHYLLDSM